MKSFLNDLLRSFSFILLYCVIPISGIGQSIVINEVSQGTAGSQEYVEFIVTGPDLINCTDTPPCLDLRLWVFDDNNGNLSTGGPQTGVGIASGACRFANDPFWSCIPAGTIIVIYNDADPNGSLPANDLSMADGNCMLTVPISSNLFDKHTTLPSSTNNTYPTTGWVNGGGWTQISMANGGDGFQIYNPADLSNPVHSVGWDEADLADIYFTSTSMSGDVVYATDCNYFSQASWVEGTAGVNESPGSPNSAVQADCIGNMNANCNPPTVVFNVTNETCLGDCDGSATAIVSGGTPPFTYSWAPAPGGGQGTATASGLCGGNYTVTITDDNGTGCILTGDTTIAAGPVCSTCFMNNLTASIGACNPIAGDYQSTGIVEFIDPPTTGQLIVEDCNGNQQAFNPPFTSPQAYTITGQNPDGGACDITAYFTSDPGCTLTLGYTAPVCICNINLFDITIGACDPNTDTYMLDGTVEFTSPPSTGTLIIEVDNGTTVYDTIINLPFSSPQTFSISGIPSDGAGTTTTVYFSDDVGCSSTQLYTAPSTCLCEAEAGTYTDNITGSTTTPYELCFGDQLNITANGDFTPPQDFGIGGITYDPGLWLAFFSCPPTVNSPDSIDHDPCYLGIASSNNGAWSITNTIGNGATIYYAPVTMYSMVDGIYAISINGGDWCYDLGPAYEVTFLPEITSSFTDDCLAGAATITVNGGLPNVNGSNFTASNLLPATASFANTTCGDGGTITINGLQGGDMWSFDIVDDNGCPHTVSGGPFPPLEDPGFSYPQNSYCTADGTSNPTITGTAGGTFTASPAGLTINGTSGQITPATSTPGNYDITYTTPGACFDDSTVTITIEQTPTVDPIADQTVCDGDPFTAINFSGTGSPTFNWTNDNTNIGLTANGTGNIAAFNGIAPTVQEVANIVVTPVAGSCTGATESFVMTVDPQQDAGYNYAQTSWCTTEAPMTPTITGTGGGAFTSTPAGLSLNATTGEITPATSTPGTYDVTYTTAGPCPADSVITVSVAATPSVNPIADQTVCDGDPFTAINFTGSAGTTFNWANDNTNIGLAANGIGNIAAFNGTAIAVQEIANIVVTPTAGSCTGTTESFVLTVDPTEDPSFNYPATAWCTSDVNQLPNITGTAGGTFAAIPAGLSLNAATGEITPATSTPGTYDVTYTTPGICSADQTVSITINEVPVVNPITDETVCEGTNFTAINFSGTMGSATYNWTNDNTNIGLAANGAGNIASFIGATTGGSEVANISVTPSTVNCTGVAETFTLTVDPLEDPSFSFPQAAYCTTEAPSLPVITGTPGGVFTVNPAGLTINATTGEITPTTSTPGLYEVTYTTPGTCSAFTITNVTIAPTPVVNPITDQTVCDGDNFVGINFTGTPGGTYDWTNDNTIIGLAANGTGNITSFTGSTGSGQITVTPSIGTCVGTPESFTLTVNPLPVVDAGMDQAICEGNQVTLNGSGALNYTWDNGVIDGLAFTPAVTTTYTVTGADINGCEDTDQVTVTVNPAATIAPISDIDVCEGSDLSIPNFNGTPVGSTFDWTVVNVVDVGFGTIGTGNIGTVIAVGMAGVTSTATVEVTPTSPNGCPGTPVQFSVNVHPRPTVSLDSDTLYGCEPLLVNFTNTSDIAGVDCTWDLGNGTVINDCSGASTIYYAGDYDVSLTVTTSAGCTASTTINQMINVSVVPEAAFTFAPQIIDIEDTEVDFENESINANVYEWDFGDNSAMSTVENPTHLYPETPENYVVTLWAIDNATGCYDSIQQVIIVEDVILFYVPNVFTPDGDIFNETFQPIFTSGFDPFDFHLMIFNRWGEVLFESYDASKGWNGHYGEGGLVQDGVYVWQIEFKESTSDARHTHRGHVTVLK